MAKTGNDLRLHRSDPKTERDFPDSPGAQMVCSPLGTDFEFEFLNSTRGMLLCSTVPQQAMFYCNI